MLTVGIIRDCHGVFHGTTSRDDLVARATTSSACLVSLLWDSSNAPDCVCIRIFPWRMLEAAEDLLPPDIFNRLMLDVENN